MSDAATAAPPLRFPFDAPKPGRCLKIAEVVIWARLPLPFELDHINIYFLKDDAGWTVVDTGLGDEHTRALLAKMLDRELGGAPVVRVICTHMHPDHIGQAGWLCRRYDAPLWMSRLEYLSARMLIADEPPAPQEAVDFLVAAGWEDKWIDDYKERYGGFGKGVRPMPQAYTRIEDRDDIAIGDRVWRVITGAGHSPEHVCLWQPEMKLFISGDQVLPKISSNVSVWPTEPAADPLNDWLLSCWRLMAAIPDEVLVLPSHNTPFHGLHARLDSLIEGHHKRLERVMEALDAPRRVVDLLPKLFGRKLKGHDHMMATGETLAHLNYLVRKGRARYELDASRIAWFSREDDAEADPDAELA
ncbi:MAG: MBL fold metallo-hydrolase [Maricaulaceae bacterium]|jgi:glyoxylase-like metal-dependent hydrolase (beta-lactamase superfamily II)